MAEDKGRAGARRAQDDDAKDRQGKGRVPGAQDSREGPEAKLGETYAQPAPELDTDDAATAAVEGKQAALGGEGGVSREEGVAAAQAGNEEVAKRFEPEQVAGFFGDNPAAEHNIHHTVAGHLAFQQLSPEEQYEERRRLHLEAVARARGDDWS
jgi:hypothetical protein